jgi:hypothetical protein
MAKPIIHADSSARKWGGSPKDYLEIHDLMDGPKSAHASVKHRVIFHSAYGLWIIEKVFGHRIENSDGRKVSVRDVAERHVIEDLGMIPPLDKYLNEMTIKPWMAGMKKTKIELVD